MAAPAWACVLSAQAVRSNVYKHGRTESRWSEKALGKADLERDKRYCRVCGAEASRHGCGCTEISGA